MIISIPMNQFEIQTYSLVMNKIKNLILKVIQSKFGMIPFPCINLFSEINIWLKLTFSCFPFSARFADSNMISLQ